MLQLIKRLLGLQKTMASSEMEPINKEDKSEVLAALAAYKRQNPAKYEVKKEALFKKYGIEVEPVEEIDAEIVKLEVAAKKAKKLNIV